jgi:hypothetical protein
LTLRLYISRAACSTVSSGATVTAGARHQVVRRYPARLLLLLVAQLVVDMRSVPGSRRLPHVRHAELES